MSGQPQITGFWEFDITAVNAIESGGTAPSVVVNAGNDFNLQVTYTLWGTGRAAGEAPWFDPAVPVEGARIDHFALNLETGVVTTLPNLVPTAPASLISGLSVIATTGPFTTGPGNDLDLGTYMITTRISLTTAPLDDVEAAFFTSYLMVIVAGP